MPSPTAPPYPSRAQQQQQAIYPPSLPSLPPLRVPETTGPGQAGPLSTKWLQPQSVQGYGSPDVYTHQQAAAAAAAARQEAYYPASTPYSLPAAYGWSPEGSPHVGQLPPHAHAAHRAPPTPQQQQPAYQLQSPYAAELAQHYPEGYANARGVPHHGGASAGGSSYVPPPQELVNLGLASRESRLDERWTSFMHESGYLDGLQQGPGGGANPPY